MKVLVHYTTRQTVFDCFSKCECQIEPVKYEERFNEIDKFYKKYKNSQYVLFFVVQYCNIHSSKTKFTVGKINKIDKYTYNFILVDKEIKDLIIHELGLDKLNTYHSEIFYKEYFIDSRDEFYNKKIDDFSNKIRLKYFSWTELLQDNEILHSKLVNILFDKNNVLNLASLHNHYKNLGANKKKIIDGKYVSSLNKIGFISEKGININNTVLHGDIGEFLMGVMISKFIEEDKENMYIFPKLTFKSNASSAIHGNDGTLYNITKKEIYYSEAKFYGELSYALSEAVTSLLTHTDSDYDFINSNIEAFRNISNNSIGDVVEITPDVKEKLIIFLMCGDKYIADDILETINRSKKLEKLKELHEIIIFILPVLNKENFLKLFETVSNQKKNELIN